MHGNHRKEHTLLYIRPREGKDDGVNGIDGINGKDGETTGWGLREGGAFMEGGESFFCQGGKKFLQAREKILYNLVENTLCLQHYKFISQVS